MIAYEEFQRMELAKLTRSGDANCAGTALYILGYLDEDTYVSRDTFEQFLKKL